MRFPCVSSPISLRGARPHPKASQAQDVRVGQDDVPDALLANIEPTHRGFVRKLILDRSSFKIALVLGGIVALTIGGGGLWKSLAPPSIGDIQRLVAAHQSDAALLAAARLLRRDPANPQVLGVLDTLYVGMFDMAMGEPDSSQDDTAVRLITVTLHNALRNGPDSPLAEAVLGEFAVAGGYDEMAVSALPRAEALGVPTDHVAVPLALALLRTGRYQDVLRTAQPEAMSSPGHRTALLTLRGRAYLGLSQPAAARESFEAALAIDAGNADALSRLGMLALWQDRDTSAAGALLARSRQAAPDAFPTLRLAGEYDYATGDYRGSAAAYGALVARGAPETFEPTPPSLGLARALIYQGDVAAARAALKASGLPGSDPALRYYRAMLAYRAGEFRNAALLAQPLLVTMADYPPVELLLGAALLASGYPETAAMHLTRYVAEVPGDAGARRLLDAAQRATGNPHAATVPRQELMAAFGFPLSTGSGPAGKDGS